MSKKDGEKMMNAMDEMLGIMKKSDQESTFGSKRINRIDDKVETNTKDIKKLKLQIA